jgi:hypothetical protein
MEWVIVMLFPVVMITFPPHSFAPLLLAIVCVALLLLSRMRRFARYKSLLEWLTVPMLLLGAGFLYWISQTQHGTSSLMALISLFWIPIFAMLLPKRQSFVILAIYCALIIYTGLSSTSPQLFLLPFVGIFGGLAVFILLFYLVVGFFRWLGQESAAPPEPPLTPEERQQLRTYLAQRNASTPPPNAE